MTEFILAFLLSLLSHQPNPVRTTANSGIYISTQGVLSDTTDTGGEKGHIPPPPLP
ncbi:hypothetical protein [Niabella soli]|nr:hypothetical protein [Niabella soli]